MDDKPKYATGNALQVVIRVTRRDIATRNSLRAGYVNHGREEEKE